MQPRNKQPTDEMKGRRARVNVGVEGKENDEEDNEHEGGGEEDEEDNDGEEEEEQRRAELRSLRWRMCRSRVRSRKGRQTKIKYKQRTVQPKLETMRLCAKMKTKIKETRIRRSTKQ